MTKPRSHRPGPWYGHWRPMSKKRQKKNGLWDRGMVTDVKKPGPWDRGMVTSRLGEKPERRRPSSIKTSRYWWRTETGVKIVTFRITANMMARNGKGRIQLFNIWRRRQEKKKAEFAPFGPHQRRQIIAFRIVANTMARNGKGRI